jgi:hypothetical protein
MDKADTRHLYRCRIIGLGLLSLIGQSAWSGSNPIPFNQWTVDNGVIDASAGCSVPGVSCTVLNQDKGFLQQQVITDSGSYVQMILTDPEASGSPATLGFTTENFIPDDNLSGFDIANRQVIRDLPQGFEQVAQIDRAPFEQPSGLVDLVHVELAQTLADEDFSADFHMLQDEAELPSGEILYGKTQDIQQDVMGTRPDGSQNLATSFTHHASRGVRLTNADGSLMIDPFTTAADIKIGDQTIHVNDGDDITLTELAQNLADIPSHRGFRQQKLADVTTGVSASETTFIDPFTSTP